MVQIYRDDCVSHECLRQYGGSEDRPHDSESITMQTNLMGDTPTLEMEWNEPFFRDCFDDIKNPALTSSD